MMEGKKKVVATNEEATRLTLTKLVSAADYYATSSPALARLYMNKAENMKSTLGVKPTPPHVCCEHCGSIFRPDNHTVRFIPRMRTNNKLAKLILNRTEAMMGRLQRRFVNLYMNRSTRVIITCGICEKRTIIKTKRSPELNMPQLTSTYTLEDVHLTKAEKKKLKKKQKKKRRLLGSDSGVDVSVSSPDNAPRKLSSKTLLTPKLGTPKFTSTPLAVMNIKTQNKGVKQQTSVPVPTAELFMGLSGVKNSKPNKKASGEGKAKKRKGSQSTLQNILVQEEQNNKRVKSGSLQHFLSSL